MWSEIGPRRISCVRNPRRYIVTPGYRNPGIPRELRADASSESGIPHEVWTFAVHSLALSHHRTSRVIRVFEE